MPARPRPAPLLFRFSRAYTDVLLFAQLAGAIANFIWYADVSTSDLIGFIYVGGDVAGLLAYFGFMLFGLLFFWRAPRYFWNSLHPVVFGLALLLLASHRLWQAQPFWLAAAAAAGLAAGDKLYRHALLHPRLALIACAIIIPLSRYGMPRFIAAYAITFIGATFIAIIALPACRAAIRRRKKRRATQL